LIDLQFKKVKDNSLQIYLSLVKC